MLVGVSFFVIADGLCTGDVGGGCGATFAVGALGAFVGGLTGALIGAAIPKGTRAPNTRMNGTSAAGW